MEMSREISKGIKRANSRVYTALVAANPEEVKANYLDISHVEGEVSFLPTNRNTDTPYDSKNLRTTGKPLRIIKKFVKNPVDPWISFDDFDMSFNNLTNSSIMPPHQRTEHMRGLSDRDWENFLYALRPTIQDVPLMLVDGEDIRKYYHENSYSPDKTLTTLWKSCMRGERSQPQMDFYVNAPCVKLLVELDDNKKVRGRALVWTLTSGETFMDRVYGNEVTTQMFKVYAEKQGWFHRTHNTYTHLTSITDPNGRKITKGMTVSIPRVYPHMPWMDTFKYTLRKEGTDEIILSNEQYVQGYSRWQRIN